jgi:hypothetical protein
MGDLLCESTNISGRPVSANSVIHTIKYGLNTHSDWSASPELDSVTQILMESELLQTYG